MKKELLAPEPGLFDLKQGTGGMVDIEFLVQYLVLLESHRRPEILEWTDNVRLIRSLAAAGIIDEITAYFLRKAYLIYRSMGHKLSLREKPAKVPEDRFVELRERVTAAWRRYVEPDMPETTFIPEETAHEQTEEREGSRTGPGTLSRPCSTPGASPSWAHPTIRKNTAA